MGFQVIQDLLRGFAKTTKVATPRTTMTKNAVTSLMMLTMTNDLSLRKGGQAN
jgi:hypothetical protein